MSLQMAAVIKARCQQKGREEGQSLHSQLLCALHYCLSHATAHTDNAQLRHGRTPSKRRAKYDTVDRRIKQAHEEYVRGDIDAHLLLRRICHVMHVFH